MDVKEKMNWKEKAALFLARQSEGGEGRRKQFRKLVHSEPRLASLDPLRALHNAMLAGTGSGLERFDNLQDLERSGLLGAGATAAMASAVGCPSVLALCTDEDSKLRSGFSFLKHKLKLCIEPMRDPFHRSWNNVRSDSQAGVVEHLPAHSAHLQPELWAMAGPWLVQHAAGAGS